MPSRPTGYAIKVAVADPQAAVWSFAAQKTMYGGRRIAAGDTVFVFASENHQGRGLIARAVVRRAEGLSAPPGAGRHTPRQSVELERVSDARRALGRGQLRAFADRDDGRPQTELDFKLYRQATDKIVGLSDVAVAFLLARC